MSTPQERVLEMMASGQVSREEAERLLAALEHPAPRQRWYLDPVAALSTTAATSVALGITLLQLVAFLVRLRFDGAMDVHLSGDSVGFLTGVLDWTVSVPPMVLIAFGVARLAKSEARLLDVALAVIGARWVLMIVGLLTLGIPRDISVTNPVLLVFALAMLPLLGLYFVNLFRSYRTATGLEGGKLWLAYLTTLIVSEALSKLALVLIG